MTIDMSQFFQVFFDEAEELLAEMEKLLLAVDVESPDPEDLNAIFRSAHSIKGGASTFGLADMTEVTHVLESLLDKIRKGEMALTAEHVDAFLSAKDILKMQLDGHRHGAAVDLDAVANVRMLLLSLSEDHEPLPEAQVLEPVVEVDLSQFTKAFRIELPELSGGDLKALKSELGLLGAIREDKDHADLAPHVYVLNTNEGSEDIVSICSFILDANALKLTELDVSQFIEEKK